MIPQWACFYSKLIWFLNLKSHEHKTVGVEKAFEEAELWGDSIGLAGTVGGEPFKQSITETKFSKDFKPYATFFAGALPAIGAALFGIRAIGDFKSSARFSERMLVRILELRERHDDVLENPSRIRLRELNARTTMVMADDTLVWNMIFSERELTAGP